MDVFAAEVGLNKEEIEVFRKNGISKEEDFCLLDMATLQELGIRLGPRNRILAWISGKSPAPPKPKVENPCAFCSTFSSSV